jgi:hypothetical protein
VVPLGGTGGLKAGSLAGEQRARFQGGSALPDARARWGEEESREGMGGVDSPA